MFCASDGFNGVLIGNGEDPRTPLGESARVKRLDFLGVLNGPPSGTFRFTPPVPARDPVSPSRLKRNSRY